MEFAGDNRTSAVTRTELGKVHQEEKIKLVE